MKDGSEWETKVNMNTLPTSLLPGCVPHQLITRTVVGVAPPHAVLCILQIENQKLDFRDKASSKVGSLNNVQHKAGGGDKKIFDDKDYLRQMQGSPCNTSTSKASSEANLSGTQVRVDPFMSVCLSLLSVHSLFGLQGSNKGPFFAFSIYLIFSGLCLSFFPMHSSFGFYGSIKYLSCPSLYLSGSFRSL